MERDRIGLNIGSMLPWSAIPTIGLPIAAWMTRRSDYAFWQVLPLRSVTVAGLERTGIPVRFTEPAWNATTFWGHLRGRLGSERMPTQWQDPLFFPSPRKCEAIFNRVRRETRSTPVYHQIEMVHEGLVEISPKLELNIATWINTAKTEDRKPFVIDLSHLRKAGFRMGLWEEPLWQDLMVVLLPYTSLIHVQAANAGEWQRFLNGSWTVLGKMLRFIRDWGYAGPFVVEFDPRAMDPTGLLPWRLAANLRKVRERIEEII